jgi:hypothetical protein
MCNLSSLEDDKDMVLPAIYRTKGRLMLMGNFVAYHRLSLHFPHIINDHVCMQTMGKSSLSFPSPPPLFPHVVKGKFVGSKSSSPSHLIWLQSPLVPFNLQ